MLLLAAGMPAPATPPAPPPATALTIDELAAQVGVPTRTIRFYQARGALMRPEIRGRVAYYGDAHVERIKLIAQLQDRGLRIDVDNPLAAGGTTPGLRAAIVIDGAPAASPRPAPALGQHTQDILADPAWGGGV